MTVWLRPPRRVALLSVHTSPLEQPGTGDAAIVSSTIELSRKLGLAVIAEGIENAETVELLRSMGCEEGQGYHFGRPVPGSDFAQKHLLTPESSCLASPAGAVAA